MDAGFKKAMIIGICITVGLIILGLYVLTDVKVSVVAKKKAEAASDVFKSNKDTARK